MAEQAPADERLRGALRVTVLNYHQAAGHEGEVPWCEHWVCKRACDELRRSMSSEPTHVDIVRCDPFSSSLMDQRLIRRTQPDDPTIGGQVRDGWATYSYMTAPHTLADCPFDDDGRMKQPATQTAAHQPHKQGADSTTQETAR